MFLSRTVAAEVCMEAKTNESAYKALKRLDESGDLLFELSGLIEELIKVIAFPVMSDSQLIRLFSSSL